jgi:hypothetical protein
MVRKIYSTLFILALSVTIVSGQNISRIFGVISEEELNMKQYSPDRDAEAVVLYDMAKSSFYTTVDYSYDVKFERATRIKILSEAGIRWAEVEIPFYDEEDIFEKVYDIEVSAYNLENGKIVKSSFDPSTIYEEAVNQFWNVKKFAIPNVKVGTVIEYRYKINSQYKFNFRDWEFQWRIPVVYSEYETRMIPFYEYTYIMQGTSKFDVFESYVDTEVRHSLPAPDMYGKDYFNDMVYKFGMNNLPAFGDEEFITSINDYIIKIDFQLAKIHNYQGTTFDIITTWEDFIKELLSHKDFGKYVSKSEKLGSNVLDIKELAEKSEMERFNTVIDYVKNNYNWNQIGGNYASKSPNKLVDDKTGNCTDLNLFTVGLLNSAGIEAYPLLISTRTNGKIKYDYPFSHFFNYVIILARVGDKMVLSDATEIFSMNDRIPPRCINERGLVIRKGDVEWISLDNTMTSGITTIVQMKIDENMVTADLLKIATEYDALNYRNSYADNIENVRKSLSESSYSVIDSTIRIQNHQDRSKPYRIGYRITSKPGMVNNKIYISPFLQETISDNPLKQKERKYPVDMVYPIKRIYNSTVSPPDGYQAEYIPEDLKIESDLFDLNYSVKTLGDDLQITLDYCFKQSIYQPGDYSKLKQYFGEIVKKGNEQIVFVKTAVAGN